MRSFLRICILVVTVTTLQPSGNVTSAIQDADLCTDSIVGQFKPDIHITHQIPQDRMMLSSMQPLFSGKNASNQCIRDVYIRAIKEYGGQEVMLFTDDNMRLSTLYFKRPNALINLMVVPGYFFNATPTKEWGAPFSILFNEFNVLIIDARGSGSSEGITSLLSKNSYGKNAYHDVQAGLEFMKKESNIPTILCGFCCGAAMALYTTVQAQKEGKMIADALVLNCTFSTFENILEKALTWPDQSLTSLCLLKTGLAHWFFKTRCNGSMFDLNPRDMIKEITIPCYFEHFSYDTYATLGQSIDVFNAATCKKMFMQSDVGRHVAIHSHVPFQCKEAFKEFLYRNNFLPRAQQVTRFQSSSLQAHAPK